MHEAFTHVLRATCCVLTCSRATSCVLTCISCYVLRAAHVLRAHVLPVIIQGGCQGRAVGICGFHWEIW